MSEINAAGAAWAEPWDMTDAATRATWTDDGLRALFDRLRQMYGDEAIDRASVARVESDGTQGDTAAEVDCRECEGPSTVTGTEYGATMRKYHRLDCGHLVLA